MDAKYINNYYTNDRIIYKILVCTAGLWLRHCRQMPAGAFDIEGPTKDGCKKFEHTLPNQFSIA